MELPANLVQVRNRRSCLLAGRVLNTMRMMERIPDEIEGLALLFVVLRVARHEADYNSDPEFELCRDVVLQNIIEAEYQVQRLAGATIRDPRTFAVYVLMLMWRT